MAWVAETAKMLPPHALYQQCVTLYVCSNAKFLAKPKPNHLAGHARTRMRLPLQLVLEKAKTEEAHGEFESEHPGYCGAQGNLKALDASTSRPSSTSTPRSALPSSYDRKTPITAADLLNDRVLPFFEEHDVKLLRVL
jgi:hypothetical protein